MSTDMIWQTVTGSSADSERLGAEIGASLKGGEVIELVGDLGGGKTTFARGLVRGAGSADQVSSPTFTLRNEYSTEEFIIYHFDFYRLNEAGIMSEELSEAIGDDKTVSVVEWGGIVENVLPKIRLTVNLTATAESERRISFTYTKDLEYLIQGLPGQAIKDYA